MPGWQKLIFLLIFLFATLSCSRQANSTFESPASLKKEDTVYTNEIFRTIALKRRVNEKFIWSLNRSINGNLSFNLNMNLKELKSPANLSFEFQLNVGSKIITTLNFTGKDFKQKKSSGVYIYSRGLNFTVSLKKNDKLMFKVCRKSNSGEQLQYPVENFYHLGNIRIKSSGQDSATKLLIISIDTLRADYLGIYRKLLGINSDKKSLSPNIDMLASESVLFLKTYTTLSSTWPALASMFSSKMPFDHGVIRNGNQFINNSDTLSRILFKKNFYNVSLRANSFPLRFGGFHLVRNFFKKDRRLIRNALKLIKRNSDQKFFFWLHFLGVHAGYRPGKKILQEIENTPYTGNLTGLGPVLSKVTAGILKINNYDLQHIRNLYSGELLQLDRWLKGIFDLLKAKGIWDSTMIILTSDHGEDLYDHNHHFFHHPSIYNSSLHIPLIIKFPRSEYKGIINQNVSIMDIMPTILDYLNIENTCAMTGQSLLPIITGDMEQERDRLIYAESSNSKVFTVITDDWKFIYNPDNIIPRTQYKNPYPIKKEELYHLQDDFSEKFNLSGFRIRILKNLKAKLIYYIKSQDIIQKRARIKKNKLSREALKELKSLGYL